MTMLHITEDTPPDMLAGAMDLTVHLPTGRAVKMSVERSTAMMDLLVQVTTNHHLQLSNYTLQALGMTPSSASHTDEILPYKPNTPIGALDTQHIRILSRKSRTIPSSSSIPKNIPPGHQPFENTFRLKVHLPRNQLYVTRVSQSTHLENIMRKVCDEKNLDSSRYELRHPGNLDKILDSKLSLSDYQITEIYLVLKGTVKSLNHQAFYSNNSNTNNIMMGLRKKQEDHQRKDQMHSKTGGGVFNLIFRRGKSRSNSLSSSNSTDNNNRLVVSLPPDNHQQYINNDDYHPITVPSSNVTQQPDGKQSATHQSELAAAPNQRPKPPQRKRRPAPKPPQQQHHQLLTEHNNNNILEKNDDDDVHLNISGTNAGLTICHSRNSSDSSGYHEASVLSDNNGNTSLPRRPKSIALPAATSDEDANRNMMMAVASSLLSQSTSNLNSKMFSHYSKSTSSLAAPIRKKKVAPPPPASSSSSLSSAAAAAALRPAESSDNVVAIHDDDKYSDKPVPVVASSNSSQSNNILSSSSELSSQLLHQSDGALTDNDSVLAAPENILSKSNDKVSSIIEESPNNKTGNSEPSTAIILNDNNNTAEALEVKTLETESSSEGKSKESIEIDNTNATATIIAGKPLEDERIEDDRTAGDVPERRQQDDIDDNASKDLELCQFSCEEETDWQYQLPSPPKDFRDDVSSIAAGTVTVNDAICSSELCDKLNAIKEDAISRTQSDQETILSDDTINDNDNGSGRERKSLLLNKLSLENLEKRQSLVYNRELATSLKMTNNNNHNDDDDSKIITRNENRNKELLFRNSIDEMTKSTNNDNVIINHQIPTKNTISSNHQSHLPNFKITTYDNPKQKLNIFEDDTIRSSNMVNNNNNTNKRNSSFGESSYKKSSSSSYYVDENVDNEEKILAAVCDNDDGNKLAKNNFNITLCRSESFSSEQNHSMSVLRPVTRSKSHIALNKYNQKDNANLKYQDNEEKRLSKKSNSLFDVSGLQSIGVMRLIQDRLMNAPPFPNNNHILETSINDPKKQQHSALSINKIASNEDDNVVVNSTTIIENEENRTTTKKQKQHVGITTPSINMGTWSDRPKIPVNVKADPDYKFSNSRLMFLNNNDNNGKTTTNNDNVMRMTIESNNVDDTSEISTARYGYNNVSSCNNNVVIKLAGNDNVTQSSSSSLWANTGNCRKLLGHQQRPHSIAFGSDFDISRVPIVRSVEFKNPYINDNKTKLVDNKTLNSKISPSYRYSLNQPQQRQQIIIGKNDENLNINNKFSSTTTTIESNNNTKYSNNATSVAPHHRPTTFRTNSYLQNNFTPVVRGFRTNFNNGKMSSSTKSSHQPSNNFSTLQHAREPLSLTNTSDPIVLFSQSNLRRTKSTKILTENDRNNDHQPNSFSVFRNYNGTRDDDVASTKSSVVFSPSVQQLLSVNKSTQPNGSLSTRQYHHHQQSNDKVKDDDNNVDKQQLLLQAIRDFGGKKGFLRRTSAVKV